MAKLSFKIIKHSIMGPLTKFLTSGIIAHSLLGL